MTGLRTALVALLVGSGCAQQPKSAGSFDLTHTTWEVVERSYERSDSAWVNPSPEPGLYVFAERHYSIQEIRESGPRPEFDGSTTDAERLEAYEVFHAHGGTYRVDGDRLAMIVFVAKGPNTMSAGRAQYDLRWRGELLQVIRASTAEGETRVTTLRRLEG